MSVEKVCSTQTPSIHLLQTLLFDKTDTTSEATQLFDKSMDVSMNKTANLTAKALSQSLKGRRRSLNTTLQNVVDVSSFHTHFEDIRSVYMWTSTSAEPS